jgi:rubrerythrin
LNTFSANEIVQLALQIEREGQAFYEQALKLANSPEAKELFRYLGAEEVNHADSFRQIAQNVSVDSSEYEEEEAFAYMRALIAGRIFTDPKEAFGRAEQGNQQALVKHAMGFEKETILFFQALRDVVRQQDRQLVDRMIAEEKEHVQRLAGMLAQ